MHSNDLIKSGRWGWDWSVDLGSSFVGAFGFYTLGSPFFWLSALFPANVFPYIVGWLYILKYVAAALAAFIFVKHYVRKRETAMIVSLLYAFSGFSQINLLFYHCLLYTSRRHMSEQEIEYDKQYFPDKEEIIENS